MAPPFTKCCLSSYGFLTMRVRASKCNERAFRAHAKKNARESTYKFRCEALQEREMRTPVQMVEKMIPLWIGLLCAAGFPHSALADGNEKNEAKAPTKLEAPAPL